MQLQRQYFSFGLSPQLD